MRGNENISLWHRLLSCADSIRSHTCELQLTFEYTIDEKPAMRTKHYYQTLKISLLPETYISFMSLNFSMIFCSSGV